LQHLDKPQEIICIEEVDKDVLALIDNDTITADEMVGGVGGIVVACAFDDH